MSDDVLSLFHPAVGRWFRDTFVAPTPAQTAGWPAIARGENTLILAPTGSGKTLAAFLYAIDELLTRDGTMGDDGTTGVHTLYLSPLKALANDIERNLDAPLEGIRSVADHMGVAIPQIRVGVRTGDTPAAQRQRMIRQPPDLLITTPESLHLLLTSVRARDMLRTVRYVIVDEIHALCPSKRGTFLALLLERLEALVGRSPVRIGLSATQKPLDAVARFLAGHDAGGPRPVTIVDAGMRKSLDLQVVSPVDDMASLPREPDAAPSVWPAVYDKLLELVDDHHSTLVFANSRRVVERLAAEMNRRSGVPFVQAHHGSVSKERRHEIEQDLKAGRLPALVATASMELGIDVGAIDLVCQVESPFSVASGLQRVGRAGHLVRATSKGRLIPKTREDLLRMAALTRAMRLGDISAVRIPHRPLDVLAQQIASMVAMDAWTVDDLFARVRCAAPYRDLSREAFDGVLELLAGRYESPDVRALRPRISWERTTGRLYALPGTRHVAILNGGTIPDTGQYPMVLEDGVTRLGELDEEFVFERRVGDPFVLGTGRWRVLDITHDRVVVAPAEESDAMMPFWKGEGLGHDAEFGARYGAFVRECERRLSESSAAQFEAWLSDECSLDEAAARNLAGYLRDQRNQDAPLPTDRTIVVDVFRNEAGDPRIAVLTPFGRAFHLTILLGMQRVFRVRGEDPPEAVYSNVGLLMRPGRRAADDVIAALRALRSEGIRDDVIFELAHTPYFALRFRRNAARALLLPRARPGKRTPLWLQRLRAHDLLAVAARHPDFPIVLETYREIVEDELPLAALEAFLAKAERGDAGIVVRRERHPSPMSRALLLDFTGKYLYEADEPVAPRRRTEEMGIGDGLAGLLGAEVSADRMLDPEAIRTIDERLQGTAAFHRARDGAELVELLRRTGGLTPDETAARCEPTAEAVLDDLVADGRIVRVLVEGSTRPERLIARDDRPLYRRTDDDALAELVRRHVRSRAICEASDVEDRFPGAVAILGDLRRREGWIDVTLHDGAAGGDTFAVPEIVAGIRRATLSRRRKRHLDPVAPESYVSFLLRRQRVGSPVPPSEVMDVLDQLAGVRLPLGVWPEALAARVRPFTWAAMAEPFRDGQLEWIGGRDGQRRTVGFAPPELSSLLVDANGEPDGLAARILTLLASRGASFLHRIAAELDIAPSTIASTLWELMWQGRVTNDEIATAWSRKPRPEQWLVRRRGAPWGGGRWTAVAVPREARSEEEVRRLAKILLHRYGVLSRDMAVRDPIAGRWRDLYPLLSRMEWAGEVERGWFVSGLSTPQFAASGVGEALQAPLTDRAPIVVLVNVNDPACPYGDVFPVTCPDGSEYVVRHHVGNRLVLRSGAPVLAVERDGERLIPLADLDAADRRAALAKLPSLLTERGRARIRVKAWGEAPVDRSPIVPDLEALGFVREDRDMVLYRTFDGGRA